MLPSLLGGLGIFLLGMVLLTDGLKGLAGNALRQILMRFVRGPLSGVGWGALVTALVQSSSATTLLTVGFVSAGLLTFAQSVGVIFGVNLGTTSTGWIVSQLGFRISLGTISPPLVLLGVVLRLLGRGRLSHAGTAIAGFGLLFVGIDLLQDGMATLASKVSPGDLPGGAALPEDARWYAVLAPRLILVGFGFLMTIIMQSSSAAMTTTLAAVASGTISLEQAAALAIGQNIGTTPKAVAASIGGPTPAKRTALAHVLFNVITGAIALLLLPWLLAASIWGAEHLHDPDPPTSLAFFHTLFNVLGVALLLPIVGPFSRMIERLIPQRGPTATQFLAPAVAEIGPVALEAVRRALSRLLGNGAALTRRTLGLAMGAGPERPRRQRPDDPGISIEQAQAAVEEVRAFMHRLGRSEQSEAEMGKAQAALHACDHLDRLFDALRQPPDELDRWPKDPVLEPAIRRIGEPLALAEESAAAAAAGDVAIDVAPAHASAGPSIEQSAASSSAAASRASTPPYATVEASTSPPAAAGSTDASSAAMLERSSQELAQVRKSERTKALSALAAGTLTPQQATRRIDALLWLDGVMYHLWRAAHHLQEHMPRDGGDVHR